jgi:hypothetical protein
MFRRKINRAVSLKMKNSQQNQVEEEHEKSKISSCSQKDDECNNSESKNEDQSHHSTQQQEEKDIGGNIIQNLKNLLLNLMKLLKQITSEVRYISNLEQSYCFNRSEKSP